MSTVTELRTRHDVEALTQEQAKAAHPATTSKLRPLGPVDRQQMLAGLVAAVAEDGVRLDDDTHLPMVVGLLLLTCPQAVGSPAMVAKVVHDAALAHRRSTTAGLLGLGTDARREADDAAFLVHELALGDAVTATHEYLMAGCSQLRDWLSTAAAQR